MDKRQISKNKTVNSMEKFEISGNLADEAKAYIKDVLFMLEQNGIMEDVDEAAIQMLAYNYSTFIKASKIIEEQGLTVTSDRGNIAEHPAVKIARDAQTSALRVMSEFGLTAKSRSKLPKLNNLDSEESPLESFIKKNKK